MTLDLYDNVDQQEEIAYVSRASDYWSLTLHFIGNREIGTGNTHTGTCVLLILIHI